LVFERLCQYGSGFATQKHGIHRLVVIGLIAHTCVEATTRFAAELGYDVTLAKDATADYSDEKMRASLDINIPNHVRLTQSALSADWEITMRWTAEALDYDLKGFADRDCSWRAALRSH
jgi:Isochorismatase family